MKNQAFGMKTVLTLQFAIQGRARLYTMEVLCHWEKEASVFEQYYRLIGFFIGFLLTWAVLEIAWYTLGGIPKTVIAPKCRSWVRAGPGL